MKKGWLKSAGVFLAAAAVFSLLHFRSPDLMEFDSYFHTKMGALVMEKGLVQEFPWMHFTFQRDNYANPYLLFHAYLGLWLKVLPAHPFVAVKLAMIVLLGLIAAVYVKVVEAIHPKWVWLSVALLPAMLAGPVYQRLISVRPHVLSILILLAGLWAILKRKWWVLAAVSFVYSYSYSAPVLLPVVALAASATFSLHERRLAWQPFAFSLGGMVAGLVLNPYFPRDLHYLYAVLFRMATRDLSTAPAELQPLVSSQVLSINVVGFLMLFLGLLAVVSSTRRLSAKGLFLFATTGMFFVLLMVSYRYVEYWPFIASLGASTLLREAYADDPRAGRVMTKSVAAALGAVFLLAGAVGLREGYRQARPLVPYAAVKEIGDILDREAEPRDIVYTNEWATPMGLFHATDKVRFVLMSDPEMMRIAYPGLFRLWSDINASRVVDQALPLIRTIESECEDPEIVKLRSDIENGLVVDRLPPILKSAFKAKWIVLTVYRQAGQVVDLRPLMSMFPVDIELVAYNGPFSLYRLR
jgi:hypothetical protein